MPALQKNYNTLADPEAREKTKQAPDTLVRVGDVKDGKISEVSHAGDISNVAAIIKQILEPTFKAQIETSGVVIDYVTAIAGQLIDEKVNEVINWTHNTLPYIVRAQETVSLTTLQAEASLVKENPRTVGQIEGAVAQILTLFFVWEGLLVSSTGRGALPESLCDGFGVRLAHDGSRFNDGG